MCGAVENIREFNEEELICGSCSDLGDTSDCPEHGKEFMYALFSCALLMLSLFPYTASPQ
jgi:hypothetical protein